MSHFGVARLVHDRGGHESPPPRSRRPGQAQNFVFGEIRVFGVVPPLVLRRSLHFTCEAPAMTSEHAELPPLGCCICQPQPRICAAPNGRQASPIEMKSLCTPHAHTPTCLRRPSSSAPPPGFGRRYRRGCASRAAPSWSACTSPRIGQHTAFHPNLSPAPCTGASAHSRTGRKGGRW